MALRFGAWSSTREYLITVTGPSELRTFRCYGYLLSSVRQHITNIDYLPYNVHDDLSLTHEVQTLFWKQALPKPIYMSWLWWGWLALKHIIIKPPRKSVTNFARIVGIICWTPQHCRRFVNINFLLTYSVQFTAPSLHGGLLTAELTIS